MKLPWLRYLIKWDIRQEFSEKWHNGAYYPESPMGQGSQEFFGFLGSHWANYFNTTLQNNNEMVGTSFIPLLQGKEAPWRDRIFYEYYGSMNSPDTQDATIIFAKWLWTL